MAILFEFEQFPTAQDQVSETNKQKSTGFGAAPGLKPKGSGKGMTIVMPDYGAKLSEDAGDAAKAEHTKKVDADVGRAMSIPPLHTINIIKDFQWTHSPKKAREDVPELILREEYIRYNPLFNQLAYNLFNTTDLISDEGLNYVGDKIPEISKTIGKYATLGMSEKAEDVMESFGKTVGSIVKSMKDTPLDDRNKNFDDLKNYRLHLEPYQRLYSTFPTGFKYKLPYFDDEYKSADPKFSSGASSTGIPFQDSIAKAITGVGSIANILNATKPGVYVEAPKYPGFPASEKAYNISFPLFNTVSEEDTQSNWQLIFLLMYQNLPNRVNRSIILPPKIYEARIPGVWYSRYAHISSINVTMQGNRRSFDLDLSGIGLPGKSIIKTIVPDAYMVDITITELIPESQNYMFEALLRNDLVTVDIRDSAEGAAGLIRPALDDAQNILDSPAPPPKTET